MTPEDDIIYEQRTPLYGGFSENDLVEQPAIDLFKSLGWQSVNLYGEFNKGKSPEGRESKRDAILPNRLKAALKKLNPGLPDAARDEAYHTLARERNAIEPIRANAELHDFIRDGVKVKMRGRGGVLQDETIRVVDTLGRPFMRLGIEKMVTFDPAGFIDKNTQCFAGAVQTSP